MPSEFALPEDSESRKETVTNVVERVIRTTSVRTTTVRTPVFRAPVFRTPTIQAERQVARAADIFFPRACAPGPGVEALPTQLASSNPSSTENVVSQAGALARIPVPKYLTLETVAEAPAPAPTLGRIYCDVVLDDDVPDTTPAKNLDVQPDTFANLFIASAPAVSPDAKTSQSAISKPQAAALLSIPVAKAPAPEIALVKLSPPQISGEQPSSSEPSPEAVACPEEIPAVETPKIAVSQPDVPKIDGFGQKSAADLALDLVLNEIVLQARLTTTATAALIALERGGELICRATTGATAPDIATCVRVRSGIAANCFHSGTVRHADDISQDTQPDAVAYRRGGVRAILAIPVQGEDERRLGVLQVFSPRANAFCDRDVVTLQALARRVATNVEMVQSGSGMGQAFARENRENLKLAELRQALHAGAAHDNSGSGSKSGKSHSSVSQKAANASWIGLRKKSALALVSLLVICGLARIIKTKIQAGNRQPEQISIDLSPSPAESAASATQMQSVPALPASNSPAPPAQDVRRSSGKHRAEAIPQGVLASSSVTIERKPLHRTASARGESRDSSARKRQADADNEAQLRQSVSIPEKTQPGSSTDPAAQLPPAASATRGNQNSDIEVISGKAAMARLTQRIEPEYPNVARQQHIQGTVLLDVIVNADGTVDGLSMVSGESQLMIAAAEAVKQWHFRPLVKNGKPVKFESRIAIDFTLVSDANATGH